jgi:iron-sulfur cluster assembly protein
MEETNLEEMNKSKDDESMDSQELKGESQENKSNEKEQQEKESKESPGPQESSKSEEITLTKPAADEIKKFCEKEGKKAVRIVAHPGGCSGVMYEMDLADELNEGEIKIEQHGIVIYVNSATLKLMKGSKIDFMTGPHGAGFNIENPNVKSGCSGCHGSC